ncbi:MAG: TrmH family RNA methyltransferase [Candidatus Sericytochromatia bacterium]
MTEITLILHNIRSLHNVGSLFRTADGAGVKKIFLTGFTGCPPRKEIHKTALGAEEHVEWEHHWELETVLTTLKSQRVQIVGVESAAQSQHYLRIDYAPAVAFILGNEVWGVEPEIMEQVDQLVQIPMYGIKESLNVAVCGGILLYGVREVLLHREQPTRQNQVQP